VHAVTRWLEKIYERKDVATQDSVVQVFEFLRQGDVKAAQNYLLSENAIEFLWLLGAQPHFDNVEFSLIGETTEDLLPLDNVEEANRNELFNEVRQEGVDNFEHGNPNYLLFVETALNHIQQVGKSDHPKTLFECGVLGLQVGSFQAIKKVVDRDRNNYKDLLWAQFKATSV
jgi:hypothetical protein